MSHCRTDVIQKDHELDCYGLLMDWKPDSGVHLRYENHNISIMTDTKTSAGGIPPYIYADIGGVDRWIWFVLAYLLALAGICPFVGSLSDLLGRRYVALFGAALLVIAMIVCSTVHSMNPFIGGMTIAGIGAGICELTSLAVTSELAPTRKRGKYVAVLVFTIVPFCPSVLWGQLIAANAGWRYCGALCGAWAAVGFFGTLFFYFPPPRPNSRGFSRKQIIAEIDWVGGFLSIVGMILFMAGLQWGGYQVSIIAAQIHMILNTNTALSIHGVLLTSWSHSFWAPPFAPPSSSGKPNSQNTLCFQHDSSRNPEFWP